MMSQYDRNLLQNFFGSYFHEDWDLDAPDARGVVSAFLASVDKYTAYHIGENIRRFCRAYSNDVELTDRLFDELRCYYNPVADGVATRAWLETIADAIGPRDPAEGER